MSVKALRGGSAMARLCVFLLLVSLLVGCHSSRRKEPEYGWVNVQVADNSVDVRVRPEDDDGNVDVHVDWP